MVNRNVFQRIQEKSSESDIGLALKYRNHLQECSCISSLMNDIVIFYKSFGLTNEDFEEYFLVSAKTIFNLNIMEPSDKIVRRFVCRLNNDGFSIIPQVLEDMIQIRKMVNIKKYYVQ